MKYFIRYSYTTIGVINYKNYATNGPIAHEQSGILVLEELGVVPILIGDWMDLVRRKWGRDEAWEDVEILTINKL